jgi:hypothetical protein
VEALEAEVRSASVALSRLIELDTSGFGNITPSLLRAANFRLSDARALLAATRQHNAAAAATAAASVCD